MSVQGVKAIKEYLGSRHQKATAKGLAVGLYRAGLFLQRESQKIVPIEYDVLRPSAFTRKEGDGFNVEVIVGYGTDYAVYVHENLEAKHAPGKQAKFLSTPLTEKRGDMQKIVIQGIEDNQL